MPIAQHATFIGFEQHQQQKQRAAALAAEKCAQLRKHEAKHGQAADGGSPSRQAAAADQREPELDQPQHTEYDNDAYRQGEGQRQGNP